MSFSKIERIFGGMTVVSFLTVLASIQVYAQPNIPSDTLIARKKSPSKTTIYVDPAEGEDREDAGSATTPFQTITYALEQAKSGNTIQLAPGNYSAESGEVFPLTIAQNITLKGDESNKGEKIVIIGGDRYISPTFARQDVAVIADIDSTIIGVTITNPNKRGTALWIESTNPTVKHSTFTNSNRDGIFVTGTAEPIIENNVFTKNGGNGISIVHSAAGEIRKNLFQNTGFGLAIGGESSPWLVENKIIENKAGLFISEEAHPILQNNAIENNQQDGIAIASCAKAEVELSGGNTFNNNGQFDINNNGAKSVVINGDRVDSNKVKEDQNKCS